MFAASTRIRQCVAAREMLRSGVGSMPAVASIGIPVGGVSLESCGGALRSGGDDRW